VFFIKKSQAPKARKVTHANFICTVRPQKKKTHRVQMTAGGHKLNHPGDASSLTLSMLDAKIHINSTISDAKQGACHMGIDIKNCCHGTPVACCQHTRIHASCNPQEAWDDPSHDIHIANDGCVSLKTRQGMHGLKEARNLAFNQLVQKLAPHGCEPTMPFTPGPWHHRTKHTTFHSVC
jgi:hypothetical protein